MSNEVFCAPQATEDRCPRNRGQTISGARFPGDLDYSVVPFRGSQLWPTSGPLESGFHPSDQAGGKQLPVVPMKKLLGSVEALLRQIHLAPGTTSSSPSADENSIWFLIDRRGVSLAGAEVRAYYQTVSQLREGIPAERHGDRGLTSALQRAIAEIVHGTDFDRDVAQAIAIVREELTRPVVEWAVLLPVRGLDPTGLPQRVGSVRLVAWTPYLSRRLRRLVKHVPRSQRERWVPQEREERTFAEVRVSAVDSEAATRAASLAVRQAIDIVNFYADFLAHANPILYFPGEREVAKTIRFAYQVSPSGGLQTENRRQGPMPLMPLAAVLGRAKTRGFRELDGILTSSNRSPVQWRILRAAISLGRAASATTPDARLLAAVTSLEAALLPVRGEIGYRLRLRCARLLTRSKGSRLRLFTRVNRIYQARSAMTHTGVTSIDDRDVETAVQVARAVVVTLLKSKKVQGFQAEAQLEAWFDELSLS